MISRICSNCNLEKPDTDFRKNKYHKQCKKCLSIKSVIYNKSNKDKTKENDIRFRKSVKRKNYLTKYYLSHKDRLKATQRVRENNKYATDPAYRLRRILSMSIRKSLKSKNNSKNRISYLKYVSYSLQELKEHIEKQFETWMTWNNHGSFNAKMWDDNDSSTWTWQVDHIIPHSTFNYTSMEDRSFKDCWALSNLRPLSAKQNIIDGSTRVRHIERTTQDVE